MHVHPLSDINNQLHIGIIMVICAAGNLDVVIRHADVVCIGLQIFRGGHHSELDGPLVAEGLVGPFPDGPDLLDSGDTVVRDKYLMKPPAVSIFELWKIHGRI